jgi:hypothetical protein
MPTPQNVHVDALLTDISNRYTNAAFIAPTLFPVIPVNKKSDKFARFGKERFKRIDSRRAPKAEARLVDYTVSYDRYDCEGYALAHRISQEEIDNADAVFDLELEGTDLISELLNVDWECRVRDILVDTTIWQNAGAAAVWADPDATPVADILAGVAAIKYANPNTIVLGKEDWRAFQRCPEVLGYLAATDRKLITTELAAEITGIPNWKIGEAWWDTSKRGKTEVLQRIWGGDVWLGYINPAPGRNTVTAGVSLRWEAFKTQKEAEQKTHSIWLETSYNQDEFVSCDEVGYVITGTAA